MNGATKHSEARSVSVTPGQSATERECRTERTYFSAEVRLRMAQVLLPAAAAQRWSLDEIASHLGVNRDHLLRVFRKQGVPSPMRQLRKLILAELIPRLIRGGESLEELAQEAGYADASSLRRAFRRAYGKSPSAIRIGIEAE